MSVAVDVLMLLHQSVYHLPQKEYQKAEKQLKKEKTFSTTYAYVQVYMQWPWLLLVVECICWSMCFRIVDLLTCGCL